MADVLVNINHIKPPAIVCGLNAWSSQGRIWTRYCILDCIVCTVGNTKQINLVEP